MSSCNSCGARFEVTEAERKLYERISPRFGERVCVIPPPKQCPRCREQRRMSWRNERNIFTRSCSQTGKRLYSAYTPDSAFPVLDNAVWWQDDQDAVRYGRPLDLKRSVFEQLRELQQLVPRLSNFNYPDDRMINSAYTNCAGDLKDCYLVFASGRNEKCLYGMYLTDCFSCVDCFFVTNCTNCYEGVDLVTCHSVFYSADCRECSESYFLRDCRNCTDCVGCVGLRNKRYHIFNQPFSPEEYRQECERLGVGRSRKLSHASRAALARRFEELSSELPKRATHGENNEGSRGDYISNTKSCVNCFDTFNSRDCLHCTWFSEGRDSADVYAWGEMELCYFISGGGQDMYGCAFTAMSYACKESFYLDLCLYCKNCFGCVGLKNKEYCLFNQQLSKAEYEQAVPEVIAAMQRHGEWGEFFPGASSPFGYNYSVASDYYPMARDEVERGGYRWSEFVAPEVSSAEVYSADGVLPSGEPAKLVFGCKVSGKLYRVTSQEIHFYEANGLPLPIEHSEVRYLRRLKSRNPRQLRGESCAKCRAEVLTTYPDSEGGNVCCERCYLELMY